MTLVMGMDQHREQIGEWIDTITGRSRARGSRRRTGGTVRTFLARFDGAELEVALEATTAGVLSPRRSSASVPRRPGRAGGDQRSEGKKSARRPTGPDARHLRELLLIGRLPGSWIAPAHLLDLRPRVRCRHTLVHQPHRVATTDARRALPPRRGVSEEPCKA